MDSLTQVLLGAAVGEAALGKKIGNKALLWGAIGGTIPDLDVIFMRIMDLATGLDMHRGFSHSIAFAVLLAPALGWAVHWLYRKKGEATWKQWSWFFFLTIVTHPILDNFTTWGTEFFWPAWNHKVAFNSIFVVDPLYTVPLLVTCTWVLFLKRTRPKRRRVNNWGLIISSAYLGFTLIAKAVSNNTFEKAWEAQGYAIERYMSKPTPMNTVLWMAIAERENDFLIGYSALTDDAGYTIPFKSYAKGHALLEPYLENEELQTLLRLTKGYYLVEQEDAQTFLIRDLRFGLNKVEHSEEAGFIFTYIMKVKDDGTLHFERPAPEIAIRKAFGELWERMKGRGQF